MAAATDSALGTIILSGDLDGSTDASNPELTPTNVAAGEYTAVKAHVNVKGQVIDAADSSQSEILALFSCADSLTCGLVQPQSPFVVSSGELSVPYATDSVKGVVQVGEGFAIDGCVLSVNLPIANTGSPNRIGTVIVPVAGNLVIGGSPEGQISVPIATDSLLGVVQIPGGDGLSVDGSGDVTFMYTPATDSTLGGVIVPTSGNLDIDGGGNVSVPIATDSTLGVIKIDLSSSPQDFTIDGAGELVYVGNPESLDIATDSTLGGVIVTTFGNIYVDGSGNILVLDATGGAKGVVQVGTNINVSSGTISINDANGTGTKGVVKSADANNIVISSGDINIGPNVAEINSQNNWEKAWKYNLSSISPSLDNFELDGLNVAIYNEEIKFGNGSFFVFGNRSSTANVEVQRGTTGLSWSSGASIESNASNLVYKSAGNSGSTWIMVAEILLAGSYRIYKSTDGGAVWNIVETFSDTSGSASNVVKIGSRWVVTTGNDQVLYSTDNGSSWSSKTNVICSSTSNPLGPTRSIVSNGTFITSLAFNYPSANDVGVFTSTDGVNWYYQFELNNSFPYVSISSYEGNTYILDYQNDKIYVSNGGSPIGSSWNNYSITLSTSSNHYRVTDFIGDDKIFLKASTALKWIDISGSPKVPNGDVKTIVSGSDLGNLDIEDIAFGNNKVVCIHDNPSSQKYTGVITDTTNMIDRIVNINASESNLFEIDFANDSNYIFDVPTNTLNGSKFYVILKHNTIASTSSFDNVYKFSGSSVLSTVSEAIDLLEINVLNSGELLCRLTKDYS